MDHLAAAGRRLFLTGVMLLLAVGVTVAALAAPPVGDRLHYSTSSLGYERFEVVQSSVDANLTIRLDKRTGQTWHLVTRSGGLTWETIRWTDRGVVAADEGASAVNYRVFTSGLPGKLTVLYSVKTGASWILREEPDREKVYWEGLDESQ